jgi:hypothetical protein
MMTMAPMAPLVELNGDIGDNDDPMAIKWNQWCYWITAIAAKAPLVAFKWTLPLNGDPDHHITIRCRHWHHLNRANFGDILDDLKTWTTKSCIRQCMYNIDKWHQNPHAHYNG